MNRSHGAAISSFFSSLYTQGVSFHFSERIAFPAHARIAIRSVSGPASILSRCLCNESRGGYVEEAGSRSLAVLRK